jgi:hypothetical protein
VKQRVLNASETVTKKPQYGNWSWCYQVTTVLCDLIYARIRAETERAEWAVLILDASTLETLATKGTHVVQCALRYVLDNAIVERAVGVVELSSDDAGGHLKAVVQCLNRIFVGEKAETYFEGVLRVVYLTLGNPFSQVTDGTRDWLCTKLLALSSDDASVLTGHRSGLLSLLRDFRHTVITEGPVQELFALVDGAHKLQSALGDAKDEEFESVDTQIGEVRKFYNESTARFRQLRKRGATISFPKAHDIRWANRRRREVRCVLANSAALCAPPPLI